MTIPDLKLLDDIKINGRHFDPEIRRILDVARMTSPKMLGDSVWVTSANDGSHKQGSKHFKNEAFDIRIRNLVAFKWGASGEFIFNETINNWARQLRLELGEDYDVVYGDAQHLNHIHIEYDPKKT